MHPILFSFPDFIPLLGGRAIHLYGVMAALGFLMGLLWVKSEAKRSGLNVEKMMDLFFGVLVAVIIGSRVMYVLISEEWWKDPLVFIRVWEGGLVFYGGLMGALLYGVWFSYKNKLSFLKVADVFAPGVALGHMFGRIGCFFAGCCHGKQCPIDYPLGVTFPRIKDGIAPTDYPVYPVQLFEAFGLLMVFLILFFFSRRKKFDGEVFIMYLIFYPLLRIFLEFYRGDDVRGFLVAGFSTSQFLSVVWVLLAAGIWVSIKRRRGK